MKRNELLELAERLEAWAEQKATDNCGICARIQWHFSYPIFKWAIATMSKWPEASGTEGLPVPAPKGYLDAWLNDDDRHVAAFCQLPRWTGEYGNSRRRLCAWLADQARKEAR